MKNKPMKKIGMAIAMVAIALLIGVTKVAAQTGGGTIAVFGLPYVSAGTGGGSHPCSQSWVGYINYIKYATNGWGWVPIPGVAHTVTDPNRSDTQVYYLGRSGSDGCGSGGTVTVPDGLSDSSFRFTVLFPNNLPAAGTFYPLVLSGFYSSNGVSFASPAADTTLTSGSSAFYPTLSGTSAQILNSKVEASVTSGASWFQSWFNNAWMGQSSGTISWMPVLLDGPFSIGFSLSLYDTTDPAWVLKETRTVTAPYHVGWLNTEQN